jgi:hypothetical protein
MSSLIESYKDPIFIEWYTNNGQKISVQRTNIQIKVVNNQAVLPEIPDETYGIDITDMIQVPQGEVLSSQSYFSVNWATGHIIFHANQEGNTILINEYWARGCIYYPASRIYLKTSEAAVEQNLQEVFDFASTTLDEFLTGDVSVTTEGVVTINNDAVTLAKIQDISTERILGRISSSTGIIQQLTAAQVRTLLNVAEGATAYTHPNHTGDVTSIADGATTITDKAVTLAKIQDIATARILGRTTAGSGVTEELEATTVRTMLNVEDGANAYTHPATHALSMIDETTTLKILTDVERTQIASMLAYLKNRVHVGMLIKDATAGQTHADADAYSFKFNLQEGLAEVDNLLKEFATEEDIVLGSGATSPLDSTNNTIIYAIWLQNDSGTITIESLAGTAAPAISATAPSNSDITTEINNVDIIWYRLANFTITRTGAATATGVADNTVRNKI